MNFADRSQSIGDLAGAIFSLGLPFVLLLVVVVTIAGVLLLLATIGRGRRHRQPTMPEDLAERERLFHEMRLISAAVRQLTDDLAASPIAALSIEMQELRSAFAQAMTSVANGVASRSNAQLQQQNSFLRQIESLEQAVRELEPRLLCGQGDRPALRPPAHFSAEIAQIVRDLQNGPL